MAPDGPGTPTVLPEEPTHSIGVDDPWAAYYTQQLDPAWVTFFAKTQID